MKRIETDGRNQMDLGAWVLLVGVVIGLLGWFALNEVATRSIKNSLQEIASQTNLRHRSSLSSQFLSGIYRNHKIEVEIAKIVRKRTGEGFGTHHLKIRVAMAKTSKNELFITDLALADWRSYPKDSKVFLSHDARLNEAITVRSNSEYFASWLLSSTTICNKLLEAKPNFISLQSQLVYLERLVFFNSPNEILFLIDLACELARNAENYTSSSVN